VLGMFSSAILLASMRTQKQRASVVENPFREEFIAKGCDKDFLDSLLSYYRRHYDTKRRKKESTSTLKKLSDLHDRLNQIASEIEQLREKPLNHILSGRSLKQSIGPFDTTSIRSEGNNLKKSAGLISRLTVRKDGKAKDIKKIYVYCQHATNRACTYSDVADLLHEATSDLSDPDKPILVDAVRKAVKRETAIRNKEWAEKVNLIGAAMRKDTVSDFTRRKLRSSNANQP